MKRPVSLCISFLIFMLTFLQAAIYVGAQADIDPYVNYYVNTGDQITDLIGVVKTQVGYLEGSLTGDVYTEPDGIQKYGAWYGETIQNINGISTVPWESLFVAWCADQAGISTEIIPAAISTAICYDWFKERGLYVEAMSENSRYIPKKGDLIFFGPANGTTATQMGIVIDATDTYVYTIEGNTFGQSGEQFIGGVHAKSYNLTYSRIYGYATPQYELVFDITGDGQVGTSDARDLLLCVLNNSVQKTASMDVDRNGEINTTDARVLLMKCVRS